MSLRRAVATLGPRMLQANTFFGPVSAYHSYGFSSQPWTAVSKKSASPLELTLPISRSFASDAVGVIAPTPSGLPPVLHERKTPSHAVVYDEVIHERFPPGDASKRAFTYFVLTTGRFIYASAVRLAILKFIMSMSASKDVLAMASLEVDLSPIEIGQTVTIKWRGKPVFIRRRGEKEIADASATPMSDLRDPQTDGERVQDPQWLVVLGVCTHLGCVPIANAGDYGGWFCPCHGSHYDYSGRIRKGPAPYNLEVPTYKFLDDDTMLLG